MLIATIISPQNPLYLLKILKRGIRGKGERRFLKVFNQGGGGKVEGFNPVFQDFYYITSSYKTLEKHTFPLPPYPPFLILLFSYSLLSFSL